MNKLTRLFALTCVLGSTLRRQLCSGCCYQTGVTSLHSWGASNLFYFAQVVLKRSKTVPVHSNYSPPLKNRQCTKQTRDRWIIFYGVTFFISREGEVGFCPIFRAAFTWAKLWHVVVPFFDHQWLSNLVHILRFLCGSFSFGPLDFLQQWSLCSSGFCHCSSDKCACNSHDFVLCSLTGFCSQDHLRALSFWLGVG